MTREAKHFHRVLADFGVPRGSVLIVHSAIATLSRAGFRAENIIEALLEFVRDGSLFMPTMTWRTVTPKKPLWNEIQTASHTGIMSEIFRANYSTARSIHPTHSVAGWGPDAARLLARHHIDQTPVSINSPYGLMRDYDAYILFVGVGLESCTAIHLPEEMTHPDVYLLPANSAELYVCQDRFGVEHQVWTRRHRRLDRDFPKFAPLLADRGLYRAGAIEGCPFAIVSLAELVSEVTRALTKSPFATLRR